MNKKLISCLTVGMLVGSLMVGCSSSEYSTETTQYLTEEGQEITDKYRENKEDYRKVPMISVANIETGELIKMEAKILSVDVDEKEASIGVAPTESTVIGDGLSIEFVSPSFLMDTEIIEDETVTIYGRFNGIKTITYEDESCGYYSFTTHFIEKGNEEEQRSEEIKKEAKVDTTPKEEKESVESEPSTKNETTKKEIHKCSVCGVNATKYHEQWLCEYCYEDKMMYLTQSNSSACDYCGTSISENINGEELCKDCYLELNGSTEEEFCCKGCGKQMNDDNGGTYACDECLNQ